MTITNAFVKFAQKGTIKSHFHYNRFQTSVFYQIDKQSYRNLTIVERANWIGRLHENAWLL